MRPIRSLLAHLDTRTWLERWSREALEAGDEIALDVTEQMRTTGWIGSPPASAQQVRDAETKLGRKLPPSLKDFYAVTNGWPVLSMGFDALRPVQELGWVRDLESELVAIWSSTEPDDETYAQEPDDGSFLLRRSLLLNTGTDHFLLDPARLTFGRLQNEPEWAAVGFTQLVPRCRGSRLVVPRRPGRPLRNLRQVPLPRQPDPPRSGRAGRGRLPVASGG